MTTSEKGITATPKHFAWWFPGSPVKVHLDLQVVRRLQEHLRRSDPGTPQAGLLFGTVQAGTTEILDFQPAFDADVTSLIAEVPKEKRELYLMGFYRTESGDTLRLNDNDLSLTELHFPKPHQVVLLLQNTGFGAPNATFFFHEEGRGMANFAFLEFPFDPSDLAVQERARIQRSQQSIAEKPEPELPASQAPLPRKRRGFPKLAGRLLLALILLASGIGIGITYFRERTVRLWSQLSQRSSPPSPSPAPSQRPPTPVVAFGFQAERHNGDLQLTWNRQSEVILSATSGILSILDGTTNRKLNLDAAQVRNGSILYAPKNSQIQMQLTVVAPQVTASESVLILLPEGSATPQVQTLPQTHQEIAAEPASDPLARPTRPFTAPVPPRRDETRSAVPLEVAPAPDLIARTSPAAPLPSVLSQVGAPPSPVVRTPPAAAAIEQAPKPAAAAAAAPAFSPPALLNPMAPVYPAELKNMALKPKTVEIKVSIDKTGRTVKAQPLPGKEWIPNAMVQSALVATQFCKFKPARQGDQAVAGELILRFTFKYPE